MRSDPSDTFANRIVWLSCLNKSGQTIPPFSVVMGTDWGLPDMSGFQTDSPYIEVVQPDGTGAPENHYITWEVATPPNSYGACARPDQTPLLGALDVPTDAQDAPFRLVGPQPGQWTLTRDQPGFEMLAAPQNGYALCRVAPPSTVQLLDAPAPGNGEGQATNTTDYDAASSSIPMTGFWTQAKDNTTGQRVNVFQRLRNIPPGLPFYAAPINGRMEAIGSRETDIFITKSGLEGYPYPVYATSPNTLAGFVYPATSIWATTGLGPPPEAPDGPPVFQLVWWGPWLPPGSVVVAAYGSANNTVANLAVGNLQYFWVVIGLIEPLAPAQYLEEQGLYMRQEWPVYGVATAGINAGLSGPVTLAQVNVTVQATEIGITGKVPAGTTVALNWFWQLPGFGVIGANFQALYNQAYIMGGGGGR